MHRVPPSPAHTEPAAPGTDPQHDALLAPLALPREREGGQAPSPQLARRAGTGRDAAPGAPARDSPGRAPLTVDHGQPGLVEKASAAVLEEPDGEDGEDRSYMRLTEKEDETLPIDIVLQTLLAFAVTCYGIAHIAGEFKDMDATSELKNKTFDTLRNHPSFYVFNHRGRVLFQSPDTVNSSSNQDALSSSSALKFRKLEPLRR
uniref:Membrane magnesium transporter 1 n=1 Tax=Ficedula albicollis TaxID=59894 RepID=A0A803W5S2_FICAL